MDYYTPLWKKQTTKLISCIIVVEVQDMTIRELITLMKSKHQGTWNGVPIDESKTRDKILYGNPDVECTGIVTTCLFITNTECVRRPMSLM